ncbi:two-component sensor histidine kinase [Pseudoxanthomonas broegbernensis]|uniref:Two-component sensor histidine kinase n=2 Tax=Pseudoxanthomonas broegbernensis TaxID=83619 RepID=A0A7V8K7W0_9GAMM|nr:two-component sensor histidine kinase [Pseudoxanthomonas broegbernensis]MBB6065609.1 signal transduction histidine kinase [Pseudoxanthomonas broegbernensis]
MRQMLKVLLQPLTVAGLLTILTVGHSLRFAPSADRPLAGMLLAAFLLLFAVLQMLPDTRRRTRNATLLAMPPFALALNALSFQVGASQVLLVIWVACTFTAWTPRVAIGAALLVNALFYLLLFRAGFEDPLSMVLINMGFQSLAAICVHYARSAEDSRDALARVNADLLATRALLDDSARDAERLRVARELHDVAGHKLTAMRLNLRALAAEPALAGHPQVALAERLSAELLADIRQVVQSLRDDRGLDLATALRALAVPFPRPALRLAIAPDVRVTDPAVAETVLRLAQEALTNAARHAGAGQVWLHIDNGEGQLRVDIHDDGQCGERVCEGNGIAGMRERLATLRGTLDIGRTAAGGMRLQARLPG